MTNPAYKIESSHPIVATLPQLGVHNGALLADRGLAVALAAKSVTSPPGGEVRVVHVATGAVVFRKTSASAGSED